MSSVETSVDVNKTENVSDKPVKGKSVSDKASIALASFGLSTSALLACLPVPFVPWFVGMPAIGTGLAVAVGVGARHRKHQLTANDYFQGLSEFFDDVEQCLNPAFEWVDKKSEPVINRVVVDRMPGFAQYLVSAGDVERDDSWLTDALIKASKIVLGVKGSGKSTWLLYEVRRWMQIFPDGIIRIVDLHYAEESPEWLPGIDPEAYLATRANEALAVAREMHSICLKRTESGTLKHKPYRVVMDEFEGILSRLSEDEQDEIVEAVRFVENEGRKYHMTTVVTFKSPKKENVRLDSSTIAQMDWLMLKNSLADSTVKWPADLDVKGLLKERSRVASLPGCEFACVYRPQSDDAVVRVIPADLKERAAAITFQVSGQLSELDQWLADSRGEIIDSLKRNESRTAIAKRLKIGKRDDSNPKWVAISEIEQELKQQEATANV